MRFLWLYLLYYSSSAFLFHSIILTAIISYSHSSSLDSIAILNKFIQNKFIFIMTTLALASCEFQKILNFLHINFHLRLLFGLHVFFLLRHGKKLNEWMKMMSRILHYLLSFFEALRLILQKKTGFCYPSKEKISQVQIWNSTDCNAMECGNGWFAKGLHTCLHADATRLTWHPTSKRVQGEKKCDLLPFYRLFRRKVW